MHRLLACPVARRGRGRAGRALAVGRGALLLPRHLLQFTLNVDSNMWGWRRRNCQKFVLGVSAEKLVSCIASERRTLFEPSLDITVVISAGTCGPFRSFIPFFDLRRPRLSSWPWYFTSEGCIDSHGYAPAWPFALTPNFLRWDLHQPVNHHHIKPSW